MRRVSLKLSAGAPQWFVDQLAFAWRDLVNGAVRDIAQALSELVNFLLSESIRISCPKSVREFHIILYFLALFLSKIDSLIY